MNSQLPEPYRLETLPLDTPDDDPRWVQYLDTLRFPLLQGRATDAGTTLFRDLRRADQSRLAMVTAAGPGLESRRPVAAFNSCLRTVNTGISEVATQIICTIGVLPTHRRRGLLTVMMRSELARAREAGAALSALTASEAVIYGRFGFAPATQYYRVEIDAHRFAYRPGVPVAEGQLEIVEPGSLKPTLPGLFEAHRSRYRGSFSPGEADIVTGAGQWDADAAGPSTTLRALAHFDASGTLDGVATFTPKDSESGPVKATVSLVLAADPAVERALWRGLADVDLVDVLTFDATHSLDALAWALEDRRAIKTVGDGDHVWLRILDLPQAVRARSFDGSGSLVLVVEDSLGFAEGTWQLDVVDSRGECHTAEPASPRSAQVRVSAETLAAVWLGATDPGSLIEAGLVGGDEQGQAMFASLFATSEQPRNLTWF